MEKTKSKGYIVATNDGFIGRTYHVLGTIYGKIPVFLETDVEGEYLSKPKLYEINKLTKKAIIE